MVRAAENTGHHEQEAEYTKEGAGGRKRGAAALQGATAREERPDGGPCARTNARTCGRHGTNDDRRTDERLDICSGGWSCGASSVHAFRSILSTAAAFRRPCRRLLATNARGLSFVDNSSKAGYMPTDVACELRAAVSRGDRARQLKAGHLGTEVSPSRAG